jgi:hypothetical protein
MDAVEATARRLGLTSRNEGAEMALAVFAGWHVPGEPWRGPVPPGGWERRQG